MVCSYCSKNLFNFSSCGKPIITGNIGANKSISVFGDLHSLYPEANSEQGKTFCQNSKGLKAINYYYKKSHLKYYSGF